MSPQKFAWGEGGRNNGKAHDRWQDLRVKVIYRQYTVRRGTLSGLGTGDSGDRAAAWTLVGAGCQPQGQGPLDLSVLTWTPSFILSRTANGP